MASVTDSSIPSKSFKRAVWKQYIAGATASLSIMASGAWFTWSTPLLPLLLGPESPVPMTSEEASWMTSLIEVGTIIGCYPATRVSDLLGRKFALLMSAPLYLLGGFLTVYFKTVPSLWVARTIIGVGQSLPYTVLPVYLGEISSPECRGGITGLFFIAWGIGCLIPCCIGPSLTYDQLTYFNILLSALFIVCFVCQPDSPYYYAINGKTEKATNSLIRLRDSSTETSVWPELQEVLLEVKQASEERASWRDVISTPEGRKALILMIILGCVSFLNGQSAILVYTTDTFTHFPSNFIRPEDVSIGVAVAALVGSVFSCLVSDRLGRRFLLLMSCSGCAICLFAASACFYLSTRMDVSSFSWLAPVAVILFNFFVTAGVHTVLITYSSELFSTKTRNIASSLVELNLTVCSFIVVKFYDSLTKAVGMYFPYLVFALISFVGTVVFYFTMPETKGKTFLEIRDILLGKSSMTI